jgi:hypothetical protein
LERLLTRPGLVREWLREAAGKDEPFPTATVGGRETLERELWAEAVRTLLLSAIRAELRRRGPREEERS